MSRYTRKQMAEKVGVSEGTIYRWERARKIQRPKQRAHDRQLLYNDEHVKAACEFRDKEIDDKSAAQLGEA